MAISDDILQAIDADQINSIAQQFGVEPAQVQAVIQDAAPAVLGGMSRNAQSDEGAASLANALGDHADANPLGDLGSLLGGGVGGAILEHVLGGSTNQVSDAIGSKAGVDGGTAQKILKVVAPIIMAYLAKKVTSGGKADPAVVKEQVEAEKQQAEQKASTPDIGSILGQILGGGR